VQNKVPTTGHLLPVAEKVAGVLLDGVKGVNGTKAPTPPAYTGKGMLFPVGAGLSAPARAQAEQDFQQQIELARTEAGQRTDVNAIGKSIIRAIPRAAVSTGLAIKPTKSGDEVVALTPLARFIFGDDSIGNFQQEGEKLADIAAAGAIKIREGIDNTNLADDQKQDLLNNIRKYKWLTLPLGILSVGSDLIPGVGGAKKAVSREVAEQLIKKYGLETANSIIERGGKALAVQAIRSNADEFVEGFTKTAAKAAAKTADDVPLTSQAKVFRSPLGTETLPVTGKRVARSLDEVTPPAAAPVLTKGVTTQADNAALFAEARKYKTADEFVKAKAGKYQPPEFFVAEETARRITEPLPISEIDTAKIINSGYASLPKKTRERLISTLNDNSVKQVTVYRATTGNELLPGDYIALDKSHAEKYATRHGGNVIEQTIPKDSLTFNERAGDFQYSPDGVHSLTEIWNRARKGSTTPPVAAPVVRSAGDVPSVRSRSIPTQPSPRAVVSEISGQPPKPGIRSSVDRAFDEPVTNNNAIIPEVRRHVNGLIDEHRAALRGVTELGTDVIDEAKAPVFKRVQEAASELFTRARESIEDSWIRVKKLSKKANVVSDSADPYMQHKLMPGRVGARLEDAKVRVTEIDADVVKTAKRLKTNNEELLADVNDYLIARHAPERNKALGDAYAAGISDTDAGEILKRIDSSPHAAEIKRIADRVSELNKEVLTTLRDGQVIDAATYADLVEKYKYHVPLNRIFDDEEDIAQALTGKGMDVKSTGLLRAKGSTRKIADITTNIAANLEQAIKRAERNRVDLATLAFARANKHLGLFSEIPYHTARKSDPQVLFFFENGKHRALRIADPLLASALKGTNMQSLPSTLRFVHIITRFYSSLATRYNPEFLLSNKLRDLQELMVYAGAQGDVGFKGGAKSVVRDPASHKAIWDYLRGTDSEGARLYKQMKLDGGTTGGMGLSTRKEVELSMEHIRSLNRSNPKKALEYVAKTVDNLNTIVEDSTRLSIYRTALERGVTRDQAAALAKDATIDFNKMGTAGPVINSFYMFSNASIQGSVKTLRAMKNPKVAGTVALVMGTAVTLTNALNDSVDEDWREKVPEWDRRNNFVIVLPSDEGIKYFTIPVSWGLKPLKVIADYTYEMANGQSTIGQAVEGSFAAAIDAYNPAGGTDVISAVTPTALDLPFDIARNRAWHGGQIRPDSNPNAADVTQFYDSLTKSTSGKGFENIALKLYEESDGKFDVSPANLNYVFEQLIGGAGRAGSRVLNTLTGIAKGEDVPVREVPIVNRFYKSKSEEETGSGELSASQFYDTNKRVGQKKSVEKLKTERAYDSIFNVPPEQARENLRKLKEKGELDVPKLFEEFKSRSTGLTKLESAFKRAPLEARGQYLYESMKEMSPEERQTTVQYLTNKKLLTAKVMEAFIKASQEAGE